MATMNMVNIGVMGGVNLHRDPAAIADDEYTLAKNVFPVQPGILSLRPSMTFDRRVETLADTNPYPVQFGSPEYLTHLNTVNSSVDPTTNVPVSVLNFAYEPHSGGFVVVFHEITSGHTFMDVVPKLNADPDAIDLGETSGRPTLMRFGKDTYCFNGGDTGWVVVKSNIGLAFGIEGVTWANGNIVKPRLGVVRNQRSYYANFNDSTLSDAERRILVSEPYLPTHLTGGPDVMAANGRFFAIPGTEPITAIADVSVAPAASPAESAVFVWTRRHCYQFVGESLVQAEIDAGQLESESSLKLTKLVVDCGCVSQATVQSSPYGLFWVGEDDVWFMPTGNMPIRIGTKIRPVLVDQPDSFRWKMHAVYDKGVYKLALFRPGQGPDVSSGCAHQWWLDLRNGPPDSADKAVWWGPQEYSPSAGVVFSAEDGILADLRGSYSLKRIDEGELSGRVIDMVRYSTDDVLNDEWLLRGISIVTFDGKSPRDTVAPQYSGVRWQASVAYSEGDRVWAQSLSIGDTQAVVEFVCFTAGVSGATEPDWTTASLLSPVADGTAYWIPANGYTPSFAPATSAEAPALQATYEPIIMDLRSKEFLFGDGGNEKLVGDVEIGYWADTDVKALVTRMTDWQQETATILAPTEYAELDSPNSVLNTTRLIRRWKSRLLPATAADRCIGNSAQIFLTTEPGIYIDSTMNKFECGVSGSLNTQFQIAVGWYESVETIAAALDSAIDMLEFSWTAQGNARGRCGLRPVVGDTVVIPTIAANFNFPDSANIQLLALLGWRAPAGTGGYITMNDGDPYIYADDLVAPTRSPLLQINTLRFRTKVFGRRPT